MTQAWAQPDADNPGLWAVCVGIDNSVGMIASGLSKDAADKMVAMMEKPRMSTPEEIIAAVHGTTGAGAAGPLGPSVATSIIAALSEAGYEITEAEPEHKTELRELIAEHNEPEHKSAHKPRQHK